MVDVATAALQSTLGDINTLAVQDLSTAWDFYGGGEPAVVRDAMLEVTPAVVDNYAGLAGQVSTDWYVNLPSDNPAFEAAVASNPATGQVEASVRWAMSPLFGVGEASPLALLAGSVQRMIYDVSRETIVGNAKRETARWGRHASATACPWCRVLATRGEVYHSQSTAMASHDRCFCVPFVERPGGKPYRRPFYVDRWEQQYKDARAEVGGDLNDIVNFMRRTTA